MAQEGYHGVVWAEVKGADETAKALDEIATQFPKVFKQALGAEISNLKRSIAATLRNYKVTKAVPVPNLINAVKWTGYSLAKKSPVTLALTGRKRVSALAKPGSVKIESIPNGFAVGHFGGLSRYASQFQDGVPRHTASPMTRHWMYIALNKGGFDVHDTAALNATIAPVSPPRPYIQVLAEKTRRDFIPGLVGCLKMITERELKKANKK